MEAPQELKDLLAKAEYTRAEAEKHIAELEAFLKAQAEYTRAEAEKHIAELEAELKAQRSIRARAKAEATAYRNSIAGIEQVGRPKADKPGPKPTPKPDKPGAPGKPDA